jgi:hypothetical protein
MAMFELISKVLEILSTHWGGFLNGRRLDKDAVVARHLVGLVVALGDLCVRGERVLTLAGQLVDDDGTDQTPAEFVELVDEQARGVGAVRSLLEESKGLLASVDARFFVDLAPLIDAKSGLLTRWSRQAELSRFSTTTLFFLPGPVVDGLLEAGRGVDQVAVADSVRAIRALEVRDIRSADAASRERVRADIAAARVDLERARNYCSTLLSATETAFGADAMARVRRSLLP